MILTSRALGSLARFSLQDNGRVREDGTFEVAGVRLRFSPGDPGNYLVAAVEYVRDGELTIPRSWKACASTPAGFASTMAAPAPVAVTLRK